MTRVSRLALVGCGHIGGSLALALKAAGAVERVVGFDASAEAGAEAAARGVVDEVAPAVVDAARGADVVVLAVPVRSIPVLAREIAGAVGAGAVVTDVGSTKARIVAECEAALLGKAAFVAGHPMAGTEKAGPAAASADLFRGKVVLVTPTAATDGAALSRVRGLWEAAGARVREIDAARHDEIMAAVSHLPHLIGYSMVGALAARGVDDLVGLTGGGFLDSTRIVSTPPPMWVDVFLENRDALLPLMERFVERLDELKAAMIREDAGALEQLLLEARQTRHKILGK